MPTKPALRLPPLPPAEWHPTQRTLHGYIKLLGEVRTALAPHHKHSFYRSLRVAAAGPTTTPMPFGPLTVELLLDLTRHQISLTTNQTFAWQQAIHGQSLAELYAQVMAGLSAAGVTVEVDPQPFSATEAGVYDVVVVGRFWSALSQVDQVLKRLRGELAGETGGVQLWGHNFDLAMLWFTGRHVPGEDPANPRRSDEQMNFGFSTGDASLPEPYFYATAYPLPAALPATLLPPGVEWFHSGWQGAVLRYARLVDAPDAEARLLDYWRTVQRAGAKLMLG